jgi:hypothetical protein
MKKFIKNNFFVTVIIAFVVIYLSACHKKKQTVDPTAPTGTLMMHLHTNVDTNEVEDYATIYTTEAGRKISVSSAQLYISNIQLTKLDGTLYSVADRIILQEQGTEVYKIGNVPVGNYKSISFQVGLDPATNLKTPSAADTSLNQSSMWFGNAAQPEGYLFVSFKGTIDTTTAANGTVGQMQSFSYRIGTNSNYKKVTMPDKVYSVTEGQVQYVHLTVDYNKLLEGVQLNNHGNLTVSSVADNATTLAATISNNIASMFSYEE